MLPCCGASFASRGQRTSFLYPDPLCNATAECIVRLPPLSLGRGLLERKIVHELCPAPKAGGGGDALLVPPLLLLSAEDGAGARGGETRRVPPSLAGRDVAVLIYARRCLTADAARVCGG